jgi:hypothetical protein
MTSRRAAPVLASVLGVALAACAGGGAEPGVGPGMEEGDQLFAAGNYDGAVRAYERQGAAVGSPEAQEKLLTAKTKAALAHADAAVRAAERDDYALAHDELVRAEMFGEDLPRVRDVRAKIGARIDSADRATAMREKAKTLVARDPAEAERLLAEARAMSPYPEDAASVKLRREATLRAEADRSAARAAEAWAAKDRERCARELAAARYGKHPVPSADALRREIEKELLRGAPGGGEAALRADLDFAEAAELDVTVMRALSDRLVGELLAFADGMRQTNHPNIAALLELEAVRRMPGTKTPSLDRVREAVTVTVLVSEFADAPGKDVDGAQIARAVRERLVLDSFGGGLPLRASDDSPAARAARPSALLLTGRVISARRSEGRVGREDTKVRYKSGSTRRPNPAFVAAAAEVTAAAKVVQGAEAERKSAADEMEALRSTGFAHSEGSPSSGDVAFKQKVVKAQARTTAADEALAKAREAESAARAKAATFDREIEDPMWAEQDVVVTTSQKTVQLTAHVELTSAGEMLLSQDVTGSAQHRETVSDAYPAAGIAADLDETPDDETMTARAIDRFAAAAAGLARTAAGGAAERHLRTARAALAAGRSDEAVEAFALYLLATPDAASAGRAEAAKALTDLLGVHVALQTAPRKGDE